MEQEEGAADETVYAGTVYPYRGGYRVVIVNKARATYKNFRILEEAETYRRERSDALGLTRTRGISYAARGLVVPKRVRRLMAGLVVLSSTCPTSPNCVYSLDQVSDGDGFIKFSRYSVAVLFGQSQDAGVPEILTYLKTFYGGSILLSAPRNGMNRAKWVLLISGDRCRPALIDIAKHATIKCKQACVALAFMDDNEANKRASAPKVKAQLSDMKRRYSEVAIDRRRIKYAYLAGLFAAEGNVDINKRGLINIKIAQKSCIPLLNLIASGLECGTVNNVCLNISGKKAVPFMRAILPFIVGPKKPQILIALQQIDDQIARRGRKRTREDEKVTERRRIEMKRHKVI